MSPRMNAMDLIPRAGVVAPQRGHDRFITASSSYQTFENITASGSSRMHVGNIYNYNNCYMTYESQTGRDPLPVLSTDQQATVEHILRPSLKRKRSASDASETTHDTQDLQMLAAALESLGQYSKSMQQESEGAHSENIAAQVALILQSFRESVSVGEKTEDLDRQVEDLKRQLRGAKRIKINALTPRARSSTPYKAHSKLTRIAYGHWEISLSAKTLQSRLPDGQMLTETCSALHVRRVLASSRPCIAAFFGESVDSYGTRIMHPVVWAYNQVGNGAQVFKLVENDDLDGLMTHFADGQASIRDCDEAGRSLLSYACHYASHKVCKFLVSRECDVDRLELSFVSDTSKATPLVSFRYIDREADEDQLENSLMCRMLLLQAGADPTLGMIDDVDASASASAIDIALGSISAGRRITEPFVQLLREGSAFFNADSYHIDGESLWLHACATSGMLNSPKILQILVEAGAKTTDVNSHGSNCLFNCVMQAGIPSSSAEFEALQYLLTVFDDIFARDAYGEDLFELAHYCTYHRPNRLGSYYEDLLYCALYRSGLALNDGIPPPPMRPLFSPEYTVQHYRALLYLGTWDSYGWHRHMRHLPLLNSDVIGQREREAVPSFGEWIPSHLLMMEERVSRAIYLTHDDDDEDEFDEDEDDEDEDDEVEDDEVEDDEVEDDEVEDEDDFPRAHG